MKKQSSLGIAVKLFIMGMSWAMVYIMPFIQYTFYDPLLETLGCSNTQLGLLLTIYGIFNIVGAPVGGWLSDRYNFKVIYIGSLLLNAIVSVLLLINFTYSMAVIAWVGYGVASLLMHYPAHLKVVRLIAGDGQNAKIFGFNEFFIGVAGIIVNAVIVYVFARFASGIAGMRGVVMATIVLSLVVAAAMYVVLRDIKGTVAGNDSSGETEKVGGRDFIKVLTSPATWLMGLSIFCVYTCAVTMSYFTPYYTAAFGGTVTVSALLAVIRTHGMKLGGGPVGGLLSDKLGSPSKALILVGVFSVLSLVILLVLPGGMPNVFIALTLVIALVVYMGKGAYYAVATDLYVPAKYAATTAGIACALGFSPDIFLFPLIGYFIDNYGVAGYRYIFIMQLCISAVGILCGVVALLYKKKLSAAMGK